MQPKPGPVWELPGCMGEIRTMAQDKNLLEVIEAIRTAPLGQPVPIPWH